MPKKKYNNDVLCVNVMDRSGSMFNLTEATVDGFNEFVNQQASLDGDAYFSVVFFDGEIEVPVDNKTGTKLVGVHAKSMPEMTYPTDDKGDPVKMWQLTKADQEKALSGHRFPYYARGSTALRDAVGTAIQGTEAWLKNHEWFKGHVVLTVTTDGVENDSHEWSPSALRAKIAEKESEGWTIVFQGSNNSWLQAADYNVNRDYVQTFANTYAGARASYTSNSEAIMSLRTIGKYDTSVTNTAYDS